MASTVHLWARSLYSNVPPDLQTKADMNPTLLVSWWATGFSIIIILIRVMGRFVRTEKLFREDKIMFWSIIPLLIRMGFVHVVLIWGTNNTVTLGLDAEDIHHREIGSKLVLAARVFYAIFIWIAKYSLLDFLKRMIGSSSWHKTYEIGMRVIDVFLALTFLAVLVSTLAECHPFQHYWQVTPDPGPQCREALAQLITMGVCDIITDLVLICFPIPLVVMSSMPMKRKVSLTLLFLMSFILIAITAYRIPTTIHRHASQQYRSLLASLEILAAAGVSNAIVIGSFVRDRGVKKAKFRQQSVSEAESSNGGLARSRTKSIALHHWGSDEDLVREFGMSLSPSLQHRNNLDDAPRMAPVAPTADLLEDGDHDHPHQNSISSGWNFKHATRRNRRRRGSDSSVSSVSSVSSDDIKLRDLEASAGKKKKPSKPTKKPDHKVDDDEILTPPNMSFFDVGGLVDNGPPNALSNTSQNLSPEIPNTQPRRSSRAFLTDIGGLLAPSSSSPKSRSRSRQRSKGPAASPHRRVDPVPHNAPTIAPVPIPGDVTRRASSPPRRHSDRESSYPHLESDLYDDDNDDIDALEEEYYPRRRAVRRKDPRKVFGDMGDDDPGPPQPSVRSEAARAGASGSASHADGKASRSGKESSGSDGRGAASGPDYSVNLGDAGGLLG